LALRLGGEIVVADPFQRYRGLEIAADSPRPDERDEVPYHLVGDLALHESSSAAQYADLAHAAIDDILLRGRVPIVSGGTGLYVRAALADLDFPAEPTVDVRDAAEHAVVTDLAAAVRRLWELDRAAAERVDVANPRRVARALALAMSGIRAKPSDELWASGTRHPTTIVGLSRERTAIDQLIATRVDREIADGLVQEIEAAIDSPQGMSREAAQIIGVKELLAMRAGELDRTDLPARLATRTRRLARAQLTWLRKTPGITEVAVDGLDTEAVAERIHAIFPL
jgi:tRNA dimethylallyltransferase